MTQPLFEGLLVIVLVVVGLIGLSRLVWRGGRHGVLGGHASDPVVEGGLAAAGGLEAVAPLESGEAEAPLYPAAQKDAAIAILVAEDNPVNRMMALRQLERLGYAADAVTNGLEAIAAVKDRPYHLILMDMRMPELNGDQATQAIRSLGATIRQPYIIALTANAMEGDRELCLAAGMNDYLSKPVLITDLRDAIGRALPQPDTPIPAHVLPAPGTGGPAPEIADLLDEAVIAEALEALNDNRTSALGMLLELYRSEIPSEIAGLVQAVGDRDRDRIRYVAHKLTGGCRQIGARGLAVRCAALELGAMVDPQEELVRHVAGIRSCSEATLRVLVARHQAS